MSIQRSPIVAIGIAILIILIAAGFWQPFAAALIAAALLAGALIGYFVRRPAPQSAPSGASRSSEILSAEAGKEGGLGSANGASQILEATLESMREGVLVIDQTKRVVAENRAAREMFSAHTDAPASLLSRRLSEVTRHPAIHAAFLGALGGHTSEEEKVELQGSQRRVFNLRVVPLHSGRERKQSGAIGVFFDITKLDHLERVRQEFLSNVSHELRTPLAAILAFVETLEDGAIDDPENNRRFLSVIKRNAGRMHSLMDDILELSAIEAGMVSIEPANVRLAAVAGDVVTALASRAKARNVRVQNNCEQEVTVTADARRLEQMLTNLIDNAIKFNREGGSVTVSHELAERHRIIVSDTGEGIPPEHLPRMFERFYRVDRARSRELGGTGLGLAIVKHLARAHGGDVRAESVPGQGSTFTIELPATARHAGDEVTRTP